MATAMEMPMVLPSARDLVNGAVDNNLDEW